MNEAIELIQKLVRSRFYGALTIKFEAGNITFLKKEETIKPGGAPVGNYRDNRGSTDGKDQ